MSFSLHIIILCGKFRLIIDQRISRLSLRRPIILSFAQKHFDWDPIYEFRNPKQTYIGDLHALTIGCVAGCTEHSTRGFWTTSQNHHHHCNHHH